MAIVGQPMQQMPYSKWQTPGYNPNANMATDAVMPQVTKGMGMQNPLGGVARVMPQPVMPNQGQQMPYNKFQTPGYNPNTGQQVIQPQPVMPQTGGGLPTNQAGMQQPQQQYGLGGMESAIQAGLGAGVSALEQGQRSALSQLSQGANAYNNMQMAQANPMAGMNLLAGGAQALGGNFGSRASTVDPTTGQQFFTQAAQGVNQYSPAGLLAQQQQLALTGAQGQDAFNQALMNNPATQYLQDEMMRNVTNQGSATGNVVSGNILRELQDRSAGIAAQDLQNQFNRASTTSGQGLQAAGMGGQFLSQAGQQQGDLAARNAQMQTQVGMANASNQLSAANALAGLYGQGAGMQSNAALQNASMMNQGNLARASGLSNLYGQGAGIASALSGQAANMFGNAGSQIGQGRYQAGRDISTNIGNMTTALSNLQNQQGGGLSDIIGQGGANLANLLSGAGQMTAGQQQQLAQLLSNLSIGEGSQIAGAQQGIGQAQAGGITGRADAIAGTTMDAAKLIAMSDERLKKNITKIKEVNGINFYKWNWNGKLGLVGSAIGVIAQEIEKLIPNAVVNTDSGYKAVDYKLVGDYINASI